MKAPKLYVYPYPLDFDKLSLFNGLPCKLSSGLLRFGLVGWKVVVLTKRLDG